MRKRPWTWKRETKGYMRRLEKAKKMGYNFINLKKLKSGTALEPPVLSPKVIWHFSISHSWIPYIWYGIMVSVLCVTVVKIERVDLQKWTKITKDFYLMPSLLLLISLDAWKTLVFFLFSKWENRDLKRVICAVKLTNCRTWPQYSLCSQYNFRKTRWR